MNVKKNIFLILVLFMAAGCMNAVKSSVSPIYGQAAPATIAIMPVDWSEAKAAGGGDEKIGRMFRKVASERLRDMNYNVIAVEAVDEEYKKAGGGLTGLADAFLYIRIKDWDTDRLSTYASLKIKASFELYSANGTRLWDAEYATSESDLMQDKSSLEYAVIDIYEPRVQRLVDAILSTLPQGAAQKAAKKSFFNWLP